MKTLLVLIYTTVLQCLRMTDSAGRSLLDVSFRYHPLF